MTNTCTFKWTINPELKLDREPIEVKFGEFTFILHPREVETTILTEEDADYVRGRASYFLTQFIESLKFYRKHKIDFTLISESIKGDDGVSRCAYSLPCTFSVVNQPERNFSDDAVIALTTAELSLNEFLLGFSIECYNKALLSNTHVGMFYLFLAFECIVKCFSAPQQRETMIKTLSLNTKEINNFAGIANNFYRHPPVDKLPPTKVTQADMNKYQNLTRTIIEKFIETQKPEP